MAVPVSYWWQYRKIFAYQAKNKKKKEIANFWSRGTTSKLDLFQKRSVSIKFHLVKWSLLIKVSYAKLLLLFRRFISFWEFKKNNWFFSLFHNFYQVNLELSPLSLLIIIFWKYCVINFQFIVSLYTQKECWI